MLPNLTDPQQINESHYGDYCRQGLQGSNFILVVYVCSVVVLFGIPANILTICVLKSDTKRNTARYLMLVLATQDLLLLILYAVYYIVPLLYQRLEWFSYFIQIVWSADSPILFLLGWFKFAEAYTIVSISIDRFVALRYPFKSARICTVSNAKRSQALIALVGLVIKLPLLILDFCYYDWMKQCGSCEPIFRDRPWYKMFWLVYVQLIDQIVTFIIPLLCLLFVNVYLIWKLQSVEILKGFDDKMHHNPTIITDFSLDTHLQGTDQEYTSTKHEKYLKPATPRLGRLDHYRQQNSVTTNESQNQHQRQRRRTHQARNISAMLVCVISVFIICETPTALYFFRDLYSMIWVKEEDRVAMHSLYAIALFTAMLNFASNFLIYGLVGRRFRWLLKQNVSRWKYMCLHCERRRPVRRDLQKRMLQTIQLRPKHDSSSFTCQDAEARLNKQANNFAERSGTICAC
ncbi:unnamed protein product [Mesocestoides corti]|uniref:G_PROTEIN_RECEP_F1_2 domain-containing protein n=1 Tax=Mesocestoides corti TaxID=53468 RepID=A0A0R3U8I1_MESCO|nr:unnamed protein product [Mesocestoides corti]